MSMTALEALQRLQEGNQQFVENIFKSSDRVKEVKWALGNSDQEPFAVILGCSDSRVPVEVVFNQGFGDLFVIRVAGNIVAPSQIGSIEFAAEKFGTRLVVVLGHTHCGAIDATLDSMLHPEAANSRNLLSIVDRIRPSLQGLMATELRHDHALLKKAAVRTNVSISASFLRHGSRLIEDLTKDGKLLVVGAEYSLETGVVDFFDGMPGSRGPMRD